MMHSGVIAQSGVSSLLTLPTTGLLAAWDARSFVSLDGGITASTLTDVSGLGHHGTQAAAGNRAAISTSGGKPSLLFDGTNDSYSVTLSATAGPRVYEAVITPTTLRGLFDTQTGRLYVGALGDIHAIYDTAARSIGVAVGTARQFLTYLMSGGLVSLWKNGAAATPVACAADAAIGGACRIGSDYSSAAASAMHFHALSIYSSATRNTAVQAFYAQEFGP